MMFTEAQVRRMEAALRRIETGADIRTTNQVRLVSLEIKKARRRAKKGSRKENHKSTKKA